ncbi:hypothetical protein QBC34DRAFT_418408 [Podospora aff. communis PSN243]|uniref:Uncharacterized protein n=1 Tax=Podospora aff. communis PSN243 TaxID=3040156 RepID=A0AAV9G3U8_9PEZI|nr:hypothetical protein QBC34DRAFT_418408 [Podospora aff. communis PSN243]
MASFGKLTNAFLQASQETTVALVNLNFDFTLIKYDAKLPAANPKGPGAARQSIFAEHAGADGTSIWGAATL